MLVPTLEIQAHIRPKFDTGCKYQAQAHAFRQIRLFMSFTCCLVIVWTNYHQIISISYLGPALDILSLDPSPAQSGMGQPDP